VGAAAPGPALIAAEWVPERGVADGGKPCNVLRMPKQSLLPSRSWPRSAPRALAFAAGAAALAAGAAGCNKQQGKITPAQSSGELGQVVARVDDAVITVGDVQERVNKQSPFIRARYAALDKKKEFLDNLIRFEVMAREAERRGYDKDPEVVRVMKQQMISKFLQKDFESKLKVEDVPDAEVEKYYKEHPEEYNRPDEVRVTELVIKDRGKADKAAAEARAASKIDPKPFHDLVTKLSEDAESKGRNGDSTFFDKNSTAYPKPVVDAAFELKEVGDISAPIKTDKGFVVLRLMQKRPGYSRPLTEVKRQIQQRLFRDVRTKALDEFIADLKKKSKITIDEANLAKVAIDTGAEQRPGGPGGPGGPGMSGMPGMPGMPAMPGGPPGGMGLPGRPPGGPHGMPGEATGPGTPPPAAPIPPAPHPTGSTP